MSSFSNFERSWKLSFQVVQNLAFKRKSIWILFLIKKSLRKIIKPFYEKSCFTKSKYLEKTRHQKLESKPGILYGQAKIYKPVEDNCPSFSPILSAIGTPAYNKLAKFFVPILNPLSENEYTVHDSFSFESEISKFNSNNLMASLDDNDDDESFLWYGWSTAFSLISSRDHCQRSSPSRISEQGLNLRRTWVQA